MQWWISSFFSSARDLLLKEQVDKISIENYNAFSITWIYIILKLMDYCRLRWSFFEWYSQNIHLTLEIQTITELNVNKDIMNRGQIVTSSFPHSYSLKSHQNETIFLSRSYTCHDWRNSVCLSRTQICIQNPAKHVRWWALQE